MRALLQITTSTRFILAMLFVIGACNSGFWAYVFYKILRYGVVLVEHKDWILRAEFTVSCVLTIIWVIAFIKLLNLYRK